MAKDRLLLVLFGNGLFNDGLCIRHMFRGGEAFCARTDEVITAPTLNELPPGLYKMTDRW